MEKYQGALFIISVCGIILFILAVKTNSHILLNFVLRSISGTITIFLLNQLLQNTDILISVGINPGTVLTTGILGFPGVLLLFGIKIYTLL